MDTVDAIVVGSGAAGVNAAWPLVEAGLRVRMLDFGNKDRHYESLIAHKSWSELRRSDPHQHRYFVGDQLEGIPFGDVRVGAQLTPPRLFISEDCERFLPVDSSTFAVTECLAEGGLASGWGAGVFPFDDADLADAPINRQDLAPHYEAVAERIGVSGDQGDLQPFFGECSSMMPPLEIDSAGEQVFKRYQKRRDALRAAGFHLGKTRLAACSELHRGRGPHPHLDMDFWADAKRAVYRPRWTLEELKAFENFEYQDRRLVEHFNEVPGGVEVCVRNISNGQQERQRSRSLVMAAGALGSTRIVLRSLGMHDRPVPVLCNPYTYVPVLNTGMWGKPCKDRRHSLAQLTALSFSPGDRSRYTQAQLYSYRSLLLFKLIKESPLSRVDSMALLRLMQPLLGIIGIHHGDRPTPDKTLRLRAGGNGQDRLEIEYVQSKAEQAAQLADEKRVLACFRKLGCWPIKKISPGHGAAIHYAGSLPMGAESGEPGCDQDCRLNGTRSVYLADGCVFPSIPAKGLTFTIMANADRVGTGLARSLQSGALRAGVRE